MTSQKAFLVEVLQINPVLQGPLLCEGSRDTLRSDLAQTHGSGAAFVAHRGPGLSRALKPQDAKQWPAPTITWKMPTLTLVLPSLSVTLWGYLHTGHADAPVTSDALRSHKGSPVLQGQKPCSRDPALGFGGDQMVDPNGSCVWLRAWNLILSLIITYLWRGC